MIYSIVFYIEKINWTYWYIKVFNWSEDFLKHSSSSNSIIYQYLTRIYNKFTMNLNNAADLIKK